MPELYFADLAALHRPAIVDGVTHELPAETIAAVQATGVNDGMPFILDDCGGYDHDLNRFFRACPTMGLRSVNSLRAYARDLVVWMRFLSERRGKKSIWLADREDVAVYHAARRRSAPSHRISAASWNRAVAALETFYGWAVEEELIAASPFGSSTTWRRVRGGRFAPVRTARAREAGARRGDLRFVGLDHFLSYRDVGLRGRQLDGREDATWSGRHGERNVLFAELLVTTGLRLEEAASLLIVELPAVDRTRSAPRSIPLRLPASIAKGGRSREIRLPARLLHRLADYVAIERANALANFRDVESDSIAVGDGPTRGTIGLVDVTGQVRSVRLDVLSPTERRRLATSSGEPMILWLNEAGRPMTSPAWAAVFRRAGRRCRALGIDLDVTPHALRHTFAVHMLSMLIREQIGAVLADGPPDEPGSAAYRRMIGDPLQKLQRLLGHASIASTYIYLDSLEESRALVEAAAERWGTALDAAPKDAL
ncbi:integrase [Bradyrhizobium sp. CCBAU 45394]|uniref:tyrosine-type recombinase/integrase n=1 Tax=Bradyrhizobium sp. CCBAU 45394 TaxID=1325087 RepID=UPI002302159A|nr:tyrosine-type recombinase/integrase [Bradyrhizobium sp. CCBAU 45394]MDA9391611.1 integrase [Bradyrhizobium sp. CCBAU 45394]